MLCVRRGAADGIVASTPGACVGGACSGLMVISPNTYRVHSHTDSDPDYVVDVATPPGATDFETDIPLDLSTPAGDSVAQNGYYNSGITVSQSAGSCASSGGGFGGGASSTSPANQFVPPAKTGEQPMATYKRHVFKHHRHGSPFGVGWDLLNVNRLYKNPHAGTKGTQATRAASDPSLDGTSTTPPSSGRTTRGTAVIPRGESSFPSASQRCHESWFPGISTTWAPTSRSR